MNENKRVTFRLNEEEIEKFKVFTEEYNLSQADGFAKLIESMELSKAKAVVSDRAKEVGALENHLAAIQSIYLTALEINQNAEITIKENYSKELNSKDQIIIQLQQEQKEFKGKLEQIKEVSKINKDLNKVIEDINKQLTDKIEEVKKVNESNSTLNGIVAEYKGYKASNRELERGIKEVQLKFSEGETIIKDLNNKLKNTENELSNIKEFYQEQLKEIKSDNKQALSDICQTYENSIKALKIEHKQEIQDLKKENKENILELKAEYKQEVDKLKADKDEMIEVLRKEIEILKQQKTKKQ
ncbi:MAG: hypothetical protein ACRCYE_14025 [Sarcina sp.]